MTIILILGVIKKKGGIPPFFFAILLIATILSAPQVQAHQYKTKIKTYLNEKIKIALEKKVYLKPIWKSLLHYNGKASYIRDNHFLFSNKNFSLKDELVATIENFYKKPKLICKFPARYFFLRQELELEDNYFSNVQCSEFEKYIKKAPADKISLVYVSENVKQVSSMMGHIFLRIAGYNYKHKYVVHGVSFFTVINTANIPLLITKSLITGMPGFFSLLPFKEQTYRYIYKENRNVWIYDLKLDEYHKKLIYYHIWELKDVRMQYLFTSYNCSTVIYYILSIAAPNMLTDKHLFVTPLDVVRSAYKYRLILAAKLTPSNEWMIRMLKENLKDKFISKAIKLIDNNMQINVDDLFNDHNNTRRILKILFVEHYILYKLNSNTNNKRYLSKELNKIRNYKHHSFIKNFEIDLTKYKTPVKQAPDSQFVLYLHRNNRNSIILRFLPASHTLSDDNRNYFSESELRLGDISISIDEDGHVDLYKLIIYSMKSLLPYTQELGGISGQFSLGVKKQPNNSLRLQKYLFVEGGIGLTFTIKNDLLFYQLINNGLRVNKRSCNYYLFYEAGAICREIYNLKTILSYKIYNYNFSYFINKISLTQVLFNNYKNKFLFKYNYYSGADHQYKEYFFGLTFYF